MHMLQLPFKLLTLTGVWMPVDWSLRQQRLGWAWFSISCISLIFLTLSSQVGWLICSETQEEFNERILYLPTGVSTLHKISVFIRHRKQLIELGKMFLNDYCIPRNTEEVIIQQRYDEFIRLYQIMSVIYSK